ncbi:hypothetical protein BDIM_13540 [Brevundimonas diminuta ATCC 11568]|nr:hypothetical protein BDIM_13540 [Brevundimonas diminuta ATCC 11568]
MGPYEHDWPDADPWRDQNASGHTAGSVLIGAVTGLVSFGVTAATPTSVRPIDRDF